MKQFKSFMELKKHFINVGCSEQEANVLAKSMFYRVPATFAECLELGERALSKGLISPQEFRELDQSYKNADFDTVDKIISKIEKTAKLDKSIIPVYDTAMEKAEKALESGAITRSELNNFDYYLKRDRDSEIAKSIWGKIVEALKEDEAEEDVKKTTYKKEITPGMRLILEVDEEEDE